MAGTTVVLYAKIEDIFITNRCRQNFDVLTERICLSHMMWKNCILLTYHRTDLSDQNMKDSSEQNDLQIKQKTVYMNASRFMKLNAFFFRDIFLERDKLSSTSFGYVHSSWIIHLLVDIKTDFTTCSKISTSH